MPRVIYPSRERKEYMKPRNRKTDYYDHETHGHAGNGKRSSEYISWIAMIQRCTNEKHHSYPQYGGRGIIICDRWLDSFALFLADMGYKPAPEYSIERIDYNGNYEPPNCCWKNRIEQARNRSDNVRITIDGETLTATEWSERSGIFPDTICTRIKFGWNNKKAVFEPPQKDLTPEQILAIFEATQVGDKTLAKVAEQFGSTLSAVQAIACGRNGSQITGKTFKKIENRK